jgi:uncharacterized cupin superfamily protein
MTDSYVLTKTTIETMQGLQKTHFLNNRAKRVNKSLGDLTGLKGIGFHLIEVPSQCFSTEYHVHQYEEECTYILEGNATVFIGEAEYQVGPGDFIGYRAGGLAHTMFNSGSQPLKCIVVGQRLDHDVTDYPELRKRLFRNAGAPWQLVDLDNIAHPGDGAGKK